MKPFYDVDGITIWCADNADVEWPRLGDVGLVLTDPPYGIGFAVKAQMVGSGHRRRMMGGRAPVVGDDSPFDPARVAAYRRAVLWGANHYASRLPDSGGWIVWDKTGGGRGPDNTFSDCELAWSNVTSTPHLFSHLWKGLVRDSEAGKAVLHPTQKPVALMRWILEKWTEPGDLVFDPYMGSGPIARACVDLGRRYIGIEIVEEYCQAAVNRLGQTALVFSDE